MCVELSQQEEVAIPEPWEHGVLEPKPINKKSCSPPLREGSKLSRNACPRASCQEMLLHHWSCVLLGNTFHYSGLPW